MPGERANPQRWARVYSLGIDLAAVVGGLSLLGYWIDRHYETDPWGLLVCFALGLIGGMYNFVRSSIREFRESAARDKAADTRPDGPGEEP